MNVKCKINMQYNKNKKKNIQNAPQKKRINNITLYLLFDLTLNEPGQKKMYMSKFAGLVVVE